MGAADADGVGKAGGDHPQHLGPLPQRQSRGLGRLQLRIARQDGGGVDDHIRPGNVLRPLADGDRNPHLPLQLHNIPFVVVRPGDGKALSLEDLDQGKHPRPTDADKMNPLYPRRELAAYLQHSTVTPIPF